MAVMGKDWLREFWPQPNTASTTERGRAASGALLGLLLTGALSHMALGGKGAYLIAPMGASAVLLFCLPASPLAQPWSILAGNLVSALVGIFCAHLIGSPLLAAPLAGGVAIGVMFYLRCLHPPGAAVALNAVLWGFAAHPGTYLTVVMLNSLLLVLVALAFNNLTGRRYPHPQRSSMTNTHATRDPVPTARLGFAKEDLDAALARYGQVLDVSRDDLEHILFETEMHAYGRRFGVITCGEIMSRDVVTIEPSAPLALAWRLLRRHRVHALPVLRRDRRVAGIVGQSDFLHHAGLDEYRTVGERLGELAGLVFGYRPDRPEVVAQIMTTDVKTVRADEPIAELVPLMANSGLHHIPVVDADGVFVGIVSQSDLLAAMYEVRLRAA
ncbi:HPP family protein [Massilia agilis]